MTDDSNQLDQLSADERHLVLSEGQKPFRPFDDSRGVHEQFVSIVQRYPKKVALIFQDRSVTYEELDGRSTQLAHRLRARGVGIESLVGVCIERSIEMVVALFGILKAGAAYVPLDPAYPRERLAVMLEDSGARFLVTQGALRSLLPDLECEAFFIEDSTLIEESTEPLHIQEFAPNNLAYVIFTSGSTGRPKGVMVEHRNLSNFFAGMDDVIGTEPGVWLAVTSISFDISVLEIFWTLCRGFTVVVQEESDRASILRGAERSPHSSQRMDFGMFYFASQTATTNSADSYRLMIEGAKFADLHGFSAVWTPERHFHEFGGIYPNPAVTTAALAVLTSKIQLRAGSVVLPLHNPIRVAEDWAVIDNLSHGRVGLSFASGWHSNDFALMPQNYERRREIMMESIATVRKLWKGEKIRTKNGDGDEIEVAVYPRPLQESPPIWIATAGNTNTFAAAGAGGFNILTNMLGQDINALERNFSAYREARRDAGHDGDGIISVMLHTFVCDDDEKARALAKGPFGNYLATSYDLVKVAPWMFPAFKQPSSQKQGAFDAENFDEDDQQALLEHAFERYFDTAGLFGSPRRALRMIEKLKTIGATEVACLVDFGVDPQVVIDNLPYLAELERLSNAESENCDESEDYSIAAQIQRHRVTHFQCTPSMAKILVAQGDLSALRKVETLLLGGEALSTDLARTLTDGFAGRLLNMYGPTETTIWSTTSLISSGTEAVTIGRPIANTTVRILSPEGQLLPLGHEGELCIGGLGVVRGYWGREDLTKERFFADPFAEGQKLYRTGDLVRFLPSGELQFLGRLDHQIKLNGYRIEMGEIEAVLTRHPKVREAVVVARQERGEGKLAAYLVPVDSVDLNRESVNQDRQRVATWEKQWSQAYRSQVGSADSHERFDTSGWLNSFDGEALPQDQMLRWRDESVSRILALKPRRILEIGCGTGMILFGCLPHVQSYTGVEISSEALRGISKRLSQEEQAKVQLLEGAADALDELDLGQYDLVVINSVIQYFPRREYLTTVLMQAARRVEEGGHLFLGDLRSFEHLREFHTEVELHQAPDHSDAASLSHSISQRVANETELLVSPRYFAELAAADPRIKLGQVLLKESADANEMTRYRYDVVLEVSEGLTSFLEIPFEVPAPKTIEEIRSALLGREILLVRGILNSRMTGVQRVSSELNSNVGDAASLRELLTAPSEGLDPGELYSIHPEYEVELRFGAEGAKLDALFRHKNNAPLGNWLLSEGDAGESTNMPALRDSGEPSVAEMKHHAREFLPAYMLPHDYIFLESLPLTPNGKIDRLALPEARNLETSEVRSVLPESDLEAMIADIWKELLAVEVVSTRDNLFEIGASSLLTVEANSRLSEKLGRKVPLVQMFRYPTIAKLAAYLGGDQQTTGAQEVRSSAISARDERRKSAAERRRRARAEQGG